MTKLKNLPVCEAIRLLLGVEMPLLLGACLTMTYFLIEFEYHDAFQQLEASEHLTITMGLLGVLLFGILFLSVGMVGYNNYESNREIRARLDALLAKRETPGDDGHD